MTIQICPASVAWGDVATWVSGVATAIVGYLAWQASSRAVDISREATRISRHQLEEAQRERIEGARIIGRLLHTEITTLPVRANSALVALDRAINWSEGNSIANESALQFAIETCMQPLLPGADRVEHRIHLLPDSLGADLAAVLGFIRVTGDVASLIAKKTEVVNFPNRKLLYSGHPEHFSSFRNQLMALTEMSIMFAQEFQEYVGVERRAYDEICNNVDALRARHGVMRAHEKGAPLSD